MFDEAEIISVYTRANAIADGTLVDVSAFALDAGFTVPVALTRTAWADCVEWSDEDCERVAYQDVQGRLWDLLSMARNAARLNREASQVAVQLLRIARDSTDGKATQVTLLMHIGPGDAGEPVITIGFCEDF